MRQPIGKPASDESAVASHLQGIGSHASLFDGLAATLKVFAQALPERTTVRQLLAFAMAMEANAHGESATLSDIRERAGGMAVGQSIVKSFDVFMRPTKQALEALGWLDQETDDDDRRRKHLRLTEAGLRMAQRVTDAFGVG